VVDDEADEADEADHEVIDAFDMERIRRIVCWCNSRVSRDPICRVWDATLADLESGGVLRSMDDSFRGSQLTGRAVFGGGVLGVGVSGGELESLLDEEMRGKGMLRGRVRSKAS